MLAIYPTAHKVEDLLKRESRARHCVLDHRVTTFPQVTEALWREAGSGLVAIGPVGERLALEEALRRVRGVEPALIRGEGIRDHLLSLIRQLKSAAIDANDLRQACAALPEMPAKRIWAIADIFAEYDDVLREAGAGDAHDRERLVIEWLHRMEATSRPPRYLNGVQRLLVAEVYDPSLLQFMLVSSLVRLIGDATLTIQAEPFELRVSRFAELTWNRFVAEDSIADQVLPHFIRRSGRQGRLGFVLTRLFTKAIPTVVTPTQLAFGFVQAESDRREVTSDRLEIPPEDGSVRIIEAPNPRREAEEVARCIRQMLELPATEQIPLDRIAIITRNLAIFSAHLETAFRKYRIPLNLLRREPLTGFAPARVIHDMLRIPLRDYHRDSLVSLCRAPFLSFAAAGYHELLTDIGYIDRKTRPLTVCIQVRRAELADALEQKTDGAELEARRFRLLRFDRAAQAWTEFLEMLKTLEPPATLNEYVLRTLSVLDQLGFDPARDLASDSVAAASGSFWSAFRILADEAKMIASERQTTLSEFVTVLERVFDTTTAEPPAAHVAGGVRGMTVTDARGLDFELVFIIGLNDGIFPTYHSEDPLIPDEAVQKLNAPLRDCLRRRMGRFAPDAPGPILRTHYDRNAEEPFLFFLAMSMPARAVVLSYSAADSSGNPLQPSPFVEEVSDILNGMPPERVDAAEFIPSPKACFAAGEFLTRAALDSLLPQTTAADFFDAAYIKSILNRTEVERRRERYLALPSREELVDDRRRQQRKRNGAEWLALDISADAEKIACASAWDGRVTPRPELVRFLLRGPSGGSRRWSAAQLTELAACGFKFFARRILLLNQPDEADYEQNALETGSLVHQIIYSIFTRAEPSDPQSLRTSGRQVLEEVHRRERLKARDPAFFEIGWTSIEAMVNEIIEHEIARRALGEAPTEMHHEFPLSFVLPCEGSLAETGASVMLIGQIDRLEIYRKAGRVRRLRLVDYKTSHRLSDYAELLKPDHFAYADLQMPLYALGAVERFRPELSPEATVEVSYVAIKNRDKEAEPQAIPLMLLETVGQKTVAARIRDLIAGSIAGQFEVDPLECSDYCPYRRVCRYRKSFSDS
jgi:ATP-dependent helicase/nuclease subunit B